MNWGGIMWWRRREEKGESVYKLVKTMGDLGHGFTKGALLVGEGKLLIREKNQSSL